MAKRTRQPGRRPAPKRATGPRPPTERRVPASPPSVPNALALSPEPNVLASSTSGGLTDLEVRRAAELEAQVVAQERQAAEASRRRARPVRGTDPDYIADVNAPLSVRAAHEYAYVARDVRRILLTGGLMVAILAVLAVLVNVLGVITL
jgi:hypothetical protein